MLRALAAVAITATTFLCSAVAQVPIIAPSTWVSDLTIGVTLRDEVTGEPLGPPSAAEFDDWGSVPITVTDPEDNPSFLNILDIAEVQVANDANNLYIRASGWDDRTLGLYLAFDFDQDIATGFDIFGLGLIGSELGYVNDFVFDQRGTEGNFNNNVNDACCTGGALDLDNGGALIYPAFDEEFGEREWAVPLDALFSVVEPFETFFPNDTFNFMIWTDQNEGDVTDVITYTLAETPSLDGDYNSDGVVDAADYTVWRDSDGDIGVDLPADGNGDGEVSDLDYTFWSDNYAGVPSGSAIGVPEPTAALLMGLGLVSIALGRRSA